MNSDALPMAEVYATLAVSARLGLLAASPAFAGLIAPPGPWPAPTTAPNPLAAGPFAHNGAQSGTYVWLNIGLGPRWRTAITQTIGQPVDVRGTLLNDLSDRPVTGAIVNIVAQPASGGDWIAVTTATTNRHGRFRALIPAGGHGRIAVVYWPTNQTSAQEGPLYSRRVLVRLRGRAWLARPRRTASRYRFHGHVSGAPIPPEGLLVALQLRNSAGNWITIRLGRTNATGSFIIIHRRLPPGRFNVRITIPSQPTWPLYAARSPTRTIGSV